MIVIALRNYFKYNNHYLGQKILIQLIKLYKTLSECNGGNFSEYLTFLGVDFANHFFYFFRGKREKIESSFVKVLKWRNWTDEFNRHIQFLKLYLHFSDNFTKKNFVSLNSKELHISHQALNTRIFLDFWVLRWDQIVKSYLL